MGEIAEAMLDGALCEGCGVYMGEGDGYPVRCRGCGGEGASTLAALTDGETRRTREAAKLGKRLAKALGRPLEYTVHNHGHHVKFGRHYNFYSSQKWYCARSGARGFYEGPFIKHVVAQEALHVANMAAVAVFAGTAMAESAQLRSHVVGVKTDGR